MNWDFFMPVRIHFGTGKIQDLAGILDAADCKHGVLVCDPVFLENGLAEKMVGYSKGKLTVIYSDITPNPTVDNADGCAAVLRRTNANFAVALGGGSSIDCAKAACAIAKAGDSIRNYHSGGKPLSAANAIPLFAIPTTAGTGSEATSVTVLTDNQLNIKAPLGNPVLYPYAAIIDPALTLSVPDNVTASTGLDVLSHALEGFWSVNHQPICDALALRAAKIVFRWLPVVYEEPDNLAAREAMCEASLLAGIAFSHPKTSGPHACSFPLTNIFKMPHGEACAFTLDAFTRLNADAENGRLNAFAVECGFVGANQMADRIAALKTVFGMRTTLAEIGISDLSDSKLAEKSMHPNMVNNPVKMDAAAVEELYRTIG
jgi:alcohol dehydrogenase